MAYFNHAFKKTFLGTGGNGTVNGLTLQHGFLNQAGQATIALNTGGVGTYGVFDAKTQLSINSVSSGDCCKFFIGGASVLAHDKIGPFHGGYTETNKSKTINPKYVSGFWYVEPCEPTAAVVHVGNTNYTSLLVPVDPKCCFEFLCGETYYLRIDVKGSPALRFANHNLYRTFQADGGCCADPTPDPVDSTLIMIQWANQIVNDPYLQAFIKPIVFDQDGDPWFATAADAVAGGWAATQIWDNYVSPGFQAGHCAGIRMQGAYVETKFGNCSFEVTDHYEVEPIKILASLVDLNGDPCTFEGICVHVECEGKQGEGFGETAVRDLILSESYRQNHFATDKRIQEITQGDQILNALNRNALYGRYYILHSVPRFNNPTGVFDNDQYLLEIIVNERSTTFEDLINTNLECAGCDELVYHKCNTCELEDLPEEP